MIRCQGAYSYIYYTTNNIYFPELSFVLSVPEGWKYVYPTVYFLITEKIIGLVVFSVFVVSYTRKVIK